MNRLVHAYFEPVAGMPSPATLIDYWRECWEDRGWETRVLSEKEAATHPEFASYERIVSTFPSVNPKGYDRACFLRHLAMANIGGGLLVDYDVFPNPFWDGNWERWPAVHGCITLLEPTAVPCALRGNESDWENLWTSFGEYQVGTNEKHVSDMTILRKMALPTCAVCVEHRNSGSIVPNEAGDGWMEADLIHFSNFSFQKLGWKGDKRDLIRLVLQHL